MDKPRPARPEEFTEALDFIDRVFRPGQKGRFILQSNYPHAYRPQYAGRILLLRDQGQIAGCLAVHPLTLRLEEARLVAGGIGAVGTDPERRGHGIMSILLEEANHRMRRAGYPLSILWGDRRRYGWFGWERGGIRNNFTLTARQLGPPTAAERRLALERFVPEPSLCRRLRTLDLHHPYGVERPLGDIPDLFARVGRQTWICREGSRFAYLAFQREGRQRRGQYELLDEAGGDAELGRSMLRVLMARSGLSRLQASAGPNPDQVALLLPGSSYWTRECSCMIKILDLQLLIDKLQPLLRRRARQAGISGRFHLSAPGQEALLDLGAGKTQQIELDEQELVGLFFGLHPLAERLAGEQGMELLGRILPLSLYIPTINYI
ncbi:MAG: GNAT family N-acetyltransferase [Candidatus Latescibacteria bacterium]|nr:GNAT family N-acetyltransferase [Candidatus Latescibacterota bacterium]